MEENQTFIPEGWAKQNGDNLFKVQGGYAFKSNDYKDEGVLLVRISNVGNNNFIYKDLIYVPKRYLTSHSNFLLNKDDVLMGLTGDLGKICILENGEFPFILNQRVGRFIFNEKVNNRFLYYLISSSTIQNKFDAFFTGGAQKNISPKQIESVEYVVPKSTTEQTTIANILSKTDQAIANTEALIAKYTKIKTGLMQDLLTKGIDENGNIRSEQTHEFKDSQLGRMPKEWECIQLKYLCDEIVDCPHSTPNYINQGVLVARTQNIKEGKYLIGSSSYLSKKDYKERILRLEPQAGDIIFTREAPIGEAFVIPFGMKICLGQRVMLFRPNKLKLNPDFLVELIYSNKVKMMFDNIVGGTTVSHLNVKEVKDFYFTIPLVEEQIQIVNYLSENRKYIECLIAQLNKLQSLKAGLMQDLLTGKVRVNNLMKEKQN